MDEKNAIDISDDQAQDRIIELQGNNYYLMDDSVHAMPVVKTKTGWHAEGDPLALGRR